MYKYIILLVSLVLAACTTSVDSEKESTPDSCDAASRTGTYLVSYDERSGTCGEMESSLVVLDGDKNLDGGCELHTKKFSKNNCRLDIDVTCPFSYRDPTSWGGRGSALFHSTGYTEQRTEDGSHLDGAVTIRLETDSGTCISTYDVTYVRQ